MIYRHTQKGMVWVDLVHPTSEEIKEVSEEFSLSTAVVHELTSPSVKSRVELHKGYIYLILHFPVFKHSHSNESEQEIDFIIGKDFLITARYDTIDALDKFSKVIEVNSILDRGFGENATGTVFFGIIQEIYESLFNELTYIENSLTKAERGIFSGQEREMVVALSELSRTLLNFKKSTDFHKEVLLSLQIFGEKIFDENFSYNVRQVLEEYYKVENSIKNNMSFVVELRETNNSLLSTKQNEIMKILTIMAFVTFPLTLIATVFSMDTVNNPIVGNPFDFWIVIGIMVLATLCFFVFFKIKKWF